MAKKKITVKGIVAAIDQVLKEIEEQDKGKKVVAYDREGTKKQLKGLREAVEGICFPDLSIPDPGDP
jgi:hypothetical protein